MLQRRLSKVIICLIAALAMQPLCSAASIARVPQTIFPKKVVIMGRVLTLKDQTGGMGRNSLAEYIPANESLANWSVMFAVRYAPGTIDPKASAQSLCETIKNRKAGGQDPFANANMYPSQDGKSAIVDFLASTTKPQVLEHNVWRYFTANNGVASFQIARRVYGNRATKSQVTQFIKSIPTLRTKLFKEIGRADLPHWAT
jgi:hypothetical protein